MGYATRSPIDLPTIMSPAGNASLGGTTIFVGTVRRSEADGPVVAIEYTAYEEMIEAEFEKIINEAMARWPGTQIEAQHRIGEVALGEASVVVVAAAPHRVASFEACRYVIEEVKKRLPIWKQEIFEDGTRNWRRNKVYQPADEQTE